MNRRWNDDKRGATVFALVSIALVYFGAQAMFG